MTRDTTAAIRDAGFKVVRIRRFRFVPDPFAYAAAPRILGAARAPSPEEDIN